MDDAVAAAKTRAESLGLQIQQAGQRMTAQPSQANPIARAAREHLGALGGAAFSDALFGVKRPGAKLGRAWIQARDQQERSQAEENRRSEALHLLGEVKKVLEGVRPHMDPRTHRSLSNAVATARSAKRPATVLRQALAVTERIAAYEPPAPRVTRQPGGYEDLKRLEKGLRAHIERRLAALSANWWVERVPQDVRDRAEDRRAKNERQWPWREGSPASLVDFLDFADYEKIIARRDNWEQAFKQAFRERELIVAKLRELEPIRNALAHSRDLSDLQRQKLALYTNDILTAVR